VVGRDIERVGFGAEADIGRTKLAEVTGSGPAVARALVTEPKIISPTSRRATGRRQPESVFELMLSGTGRGGTSLVVALTTCGSPTEWSGSTSSRVETMNAERLMSYTGAPRRVR